MFNFVDDCLISFLKKEFDSVEVSEKSDGLQLVSCYSSLPYN